MAPTPRAEQQSERWQTESETEEKQHATSSPDRISDFNPPSKTLIFRLNDKPNKPTSRAKADRGRTERGKEKKKKRARKHPSTTVYCCSRLIAPQAAGCWCCLSGPSPKWGYPDEGGRAKRVGQWPPRSGHCWRILETAARSPHGWTRYRR